MTMIPDINRRFSLDAAQSASLYARICISWPDRYQTHLLSFPLDIAKLELLPSNVPRLGFRDVDLADIQKMYYQVLSNSQCAVKWSNQRSIFIQRSFGSLFVWLTHNCWSVNWFRVNLFKLFDHSAACEIFITVLLLQNLASMTRMYLTWPSVFSENSFFNCNVMLLILIYTLGSSPK